MEFEMSKLVRFLLVGGFLGAGKTTTIARLARHYMDQGLQVGLVTNDQAHDLVDTKSLEAQGFLVGEVSGACFCCRFDDLIETLSEMGSGRVPDLIIAEPVGSCTDLIATVVEPLRQKFSDRYLVGPLTVLLKPEHGLRILRQQTSGGFSPQAAYIFSKQIEEADIVAINKIDSLTEEARDELKQLVSARFPKKHVVAVSARRGDNFIQLVQAIEGSEVTKGESLELDYDTYAAGEAELGWLNCQLKAEALEKAFSLDELVLDIVIELGSNLEAEQVEIAHVKVLGQHGDDVAVANQVAADVPPELSRPSGQMVMSADLIVNARVAATPDTLSAAFHESLASCFDRHHLEMHLGQLRCFQPGRPDPTYRL
jgi:G3E family GTPase